MTGGSHSRGPPVSGSRWERAARGERPLRLTRGPGRSAAQAAGGRGGAALLGWASAAHAGEREGRRWAEREREEPAHKGRKPFFLFKRALNQILHHIYKPKFDLLT
jgi:hypothetical protein